jgi:hypothetical protein
VVSGCMPVVLPSTRIPGAVGVGLVRITSPVDKLLNQRNIDILAFEASLTDCTCLETGPTCTKFVAIAKEAKQPSND